MDLHVVHDTPSGGPNLQEHEDRLYVRARFLEEAPEALIGFRFRDAYLYVPVSDELVRVISYRIGRVGPVEARGRVFEVGT